MSDWGLIAKYLTGEATEKEKAVVEHWLNEHPSNRVLLGQLKQAVRPGKEELPDFSRSMAEDWAKILDKTSVNRSRQFNLRLFLKVAAILIMTFTIGVALWKSRPPSNETYTAHDRVMQVTLSDGSAVWMNKGTSLALSPEFGNDERKVILKGEAFFEVAKDRQRPFIIQTNDVNTRVTGTAFNIKVDSSEIMVAVIEGEVSVTHRAHSVGLEAGESALFSTSEQRLQKKKNQDINFLSWKTGIVRFNAATLSEVCVFLSNYYQAEIRPAESIASDRITAVFDHLSLDQAIQVIAMTHDLQVIKEGTVVILAP